jgi:hypothetical protein
MEQFYEWTSRELYNLWCGKVVARLVGTNTELKEKRWATWRNQITGKYRRNGRARRETHGNKRGWSGISSLNPFLFSSCPHTSFWTTDISELNLKCHYFPYADYPMTAVIVIFLKQNHITILPDVFRAIGAPSSPIKTGTEADHACSLWNRHKKPSASQSFLCLAIRIIPYFIFFYWTYISVFLWTTTIRSSCLLLLLSWCMSVFSVSYLPEVLIFENWCWHS